MNLKRAPGQESRRVDPYCETFINLIELQQVVDLTISTFKETSHHRFHHCIYFFGKLIVLKHTQNRNVK